VHDVCLKWMRTTSLNSKGNLVDNTTKDHFDLVCCFCGKKEGACMQCEYGNCLKSFHVRCAVDQSLIAHHMDSQVNPLVEGDIKVFCNPHIRVGITMLKRQVKTKKRKQREAKRKEKKTVKLDGSLYSTNDISDEEQRATSSPLSIKQMVQMYVQRS